MSAEEWVIESSSYLQPSHSHRSIEQHNGSADEYIYCGKIKQDFPHAILYAQRQKILCSSSIFIDMYAERKTVWIRAELFWKFPFLLYFPFGLNNMIYENHLYFNVQTLDILFLIISHFHIFPFLYHSLFRLYESQLPITSSFSFLILIDERNFGVFSIPL